MICLQISQPALPRQMFTQGKEIEIWSYLLFITTVYAYIYAPYFSKMLYYTAQSSAYMSRQMAHDSNVASLAVDILVRECKVWPDPQKRS